MDNEFHQQLLTAKFPMGKHRGESLARVIVEDINYCIWVIQQAWFQEKYPAAFCQTKMSGPLHMNFGVDTTRNELL